jgi:hypothetical protein
VNFHIQLLFITIFSACLSGGCKKDEPAQPDNRVDIIAGTYSGWEHRYGTHMSAPDSGIVEVFVKKTDASSFEIIYEHRGDPYPKKFTYAGHEYKFLSPGPNSVYHHAVTFTPEEGKLLIDITYDDNQGHALYIHFTGKK